MLWWCSRELRRSKTETYTQRDRQKERGWGEGGGGREHLKWVMIKKDKTHSTLLNHLDPWCTYPSLWIGSSVGSKATGSDPPSGLEYRVGGFPHFSCPQSTRGDTRTVLGLSPSRTCIKLCSQPKFITRKSSLQLPFRTRKHQTIWRTNVENSTSRYPYSTSPAEIQN